MCPGKKKEEDGVCKLAALEGHLLTILLRALLSFRRSCYRVKLQSGEWYIKASNPLSPVFAWIVLGTTNTSSTFGELR